MKTKHVDYDTDRKPVVKVPATETPIKQKQENLSPMTPTVASKSKYSEKVMPDNGVTDSSSAKLQKASRLDGRVGKSSAHKSLS